MAWPPRKSLRKSGKGGCHLFILYQGKMVVSRCWRVFDMLYLESRAHAQDYAPLFKTAVRANLVEGALEQVKASLPPPAASRESRGQEQGN
jgi:hypothetical protein